MIKNILFDYGGVLVDWNPHHMYDEHFGSVKKADWFIDNICTYEWNEQHDKGKPIRQGTDELVAKFPEWEKEIRMYYGEFPKMISGQIPAMEDYVISLKKRGFRVFGLSNWSSETFALVEHVYPIFSLMEDMVVSGRVGLLKPNNDIFLYALKKFGIRADESVFVDDREKNVEGARQCGLNGIVFRNPEQLQADFEKLLNSQA